MQAREQPPTSYFCHSSYTLPATNPPPTGAPTPHRPPPHNAPSGAGWEAWGKGAPERGI